MIRLVIGLVIYIAGVFITATLLQIWAKKTNGEPWEGEEFYGVIALWPLSLPLFIIVFGTELLFKTISQASHRLVYGSKNKTRIDYTPEDLEEVEEFLKQEKITKL